MKKSKFEQWNLEDSQRLRMLWDDFVERTGMRQVDFARLYELGSQGNVAHYVNSRQPLNLEAARKFAKGMGCRLEDISPTLAEKAISAIDLVDMSEGDFTNIRRFDLKASAGQGRLVFDYDSLEPFKIRTDFLKKHGASEKNTFFMTVKGDSMEPMIPDGADVLVVENGHEIIDGKVYVFFLNKEIYIKSLSKTDAGIVALSHNHAYRPIFIGSKDDFKMIGKAVMCSFEL